MQEHNGRLYLCGAVVVKFSACLTLNSKILVRSSTYSKQVFWCRQMLVRILLSNQTDVDDTNATTLLTNRVATLKQNIDFKILMTQHHKHRSVWNKLVMVQNYPMSNYRKVHILEKVVVTEINRLITIQSVGFERQPSRLKVSRLAIVYICCELGK